MASSEPAGTTLRSVTLLSIGLAGSPSDPLRQWVDGIVRELEGHVVESSPELYRVAFGIPLTHEDDPARGIRAALKLQQSLRERTPPGGELPEDFGVMVGITTGRAPAAPPDAEPALTQEIEGVADRLQSACPTGTVLVSHETYRQVRGLFEVEPQPPLRMPGQRLPLITYAVLREKTERSYIGTREVLGVETEMIGRDAEFTLLMDVFNRCADRSRSAIVTVVGEPGLGKSRLLHEYLKRIEASRRRVFLMRARATVESADEPFHLLGAMVKSSAGIREQDNLEDARTKLSRYVEDRLGLQVRRGGRRAYDPELVPVEDLPYPRDYPGQAAHFLGELIGIPYPDSPSLAALRHDPQQVRQHAFLAVERLLGRGARRAPLVVELEDVQWADPSSLSLFEHLVGVLSDVPFLIIAAARPEIDVRRPSWIQGSPSRVAIRLNPLDEEATRDLSAHLLSEVQGIPAALIDTIADRTLGTPYFAEEMVKALADRALIVQDGSGWVYRGEASAEPALPESVQAVIQERFGRLPLAEQAVARVAAVMGRCFWDCALEDLCADRDVVGLVDELPPASQVAPILSELRRREFLQIQPASAFPSCSEYLFVHDLLRDVIYQSIGAETRARLHLKVAAWLKGRTRERSREWLATVAGHFEAGGERTTAADYFLQAGRAAADLYANEQALSLFQRAIGVEDREGSSRAREHLACARVRQRIGDWDRALGDLEVAEGAAEAEGDAELRSEIQGLWSSIATTQGRFEEGQQRAEQALESARSTGSRVSEADALARLADVTARRGERDAAAELRNQELEIRRELGDERALAESLLTIATNQAELEEALPTYTQALALFRRLGDKSQIAHALHSLAMGHQNIGDYPRALELYEESLQIRREAGDRPYMAWNLHNMCNILLVEGERQRAESLNGESIGISLAVGNRPGVAYGLMNQGDLQVSRGQVDAAIASMEEARQVFHEVGERPQEAITLQMLADLHRMDGRLARAVASVEAARALTLETGSAERSALEASEAGVLQSLGRVVEARERLETLLAGPRPGRGTPDWWDVLDQLTRVLLVLGDVDGAARLLKDAPDAVPGRTMRLQIASLEQRVGPSSASAVRELLEEARELDDARVLSRVVLDVAEGLDDQSEASVIHGLSDLIPALADRGLRYRAAHTLAAYFASASDTARAQRFDGLARREVEFLQAYLPADAKEAFRAHPWVTPILSAS